MGRGAVDEGCARSGKPASLTDNRAGPIIVAAVERAPHIVLVARGDTQANNVDQKVFALSRGRTWQSARLERSDFLRQGFGDRDFRQLGGHDGSNVGMAFAVGNQIRKIFE
jgi:hypothetical protein